METPNQLSSTTRESEASQVAVQDDLRLELREVAQELRKLIDKIEGQKKRDRWDKFQMLSSFFSGVLLATVGLIFTLVYNHREAQRQEQTQNVQNRVAELQAIVGLTPLLASDNEKIREYATKALQAIKDGGPISGATASKPADPQVLDRFVAIALSDKASVQERSDATKSIAELALNQSAPLDVREKATEAITTLAASDNVPAEVRETANEFLKQIKAVGPDEIAGVVATQEHSRTINEVILHSTFGPSIDKYQGARTILSIAEFELVRLGWKKVGWHYAVAPDGVIWLGTPMDKLGSRTGDNKVDDISVQVTMVMNGDKEVPTEAQKKSLAKLLKALFDRLKIDPNANFSEGRGFHRDHAQKGRTSCPGGMIKKDMVLEWLRTYGA